MSVAFRRESDDEHLEPKFELPIPPGPNLVTPAGRVLIEDRIRTLEASLATSIGAWGSLPANITVSRRRSVSVILDDLNDNAGEIAVICPRTEDTSNRADVSEDITIGIVFFVPRMRRQIDRPSSPGSIKSSTIRS